VINQDAIDSWSAVHALTGLAAGLWGLSPIVAFGSAVAYEVVEYAHEWPRGSKLFGSKRPESALNVASDLAFYTAAYWLGGKSPSRGAAVVALGLAAVIAYTLMPKG